MSLNWKEVDRLAKAHHLESRTHDEETLRRWLEFWWCNKFGKPFKEPLLQEYTTDDLIYEYLRYWYTEHDPKVEMEAAKKKKADDEWIRRQLDRVAKENAEILAKEAAKPEVKKDPEPTPTPELPDLTTSIKF
jgi:hypothetical protein